MGIEIIQLCEYGCGKEAKYQFKNGKWCCSEKWQSCPEYRQNLKIQMSGKNNPMHGKRHTKEAKEKQGKARLGKEPWNKGVPRKERVKAVLREKLKGREPWNKGKKDIYSEETLDKMRNRVVTEETKHKLRMRNKLTINDIKKRYPFFSKIEEMRYNPDKPNEKEIQVHCKNHNCDNSKEKGGWFTPSGHQFDGRRRSLEDKNGNEGSYLYCSNECKNACILYNLRSDPFEKTEIPYTQEEIQLWRETVLKQDNYKCQKCGSTENLHCHHIIPIKIDSRFVLDPDNGIVLCQKCHYEIGHKTGTECSYGNLAYKTKTCSPPKK